MTILTPNIPESKLKPGSYTDFNLFAGAVGLPLNNQRLLLIAQKLAAGVAVDNVALQIVTSYDAAYQFGIGSVAYRMYLAARRLNRDHEIWIVSQSDAAAAAAATGTETLSGTATGNGTLTFYVGYDRVDVGVLTGDAFGDLATRARAALSAKTELPVAITGTAGAIIATFKNKGTVGNGFQIHVTCSAPGITLSSAAVTLAAGATDPDIQDALDAVFPARFHVIAPWTAVQADLVKVRDHLQNVSSAVEQHPGRAYAVAPAASTLTDNTTIAAALNHERMSLAWYRGSWSPTYEIAAAIGMTVAQESDPALIFNGCVLTGIHAPSVADRLSGTEQEAMLAGGVTPLEVDGSGNTTITRLVTTRTSFNNTPTLRMLDTTPIAIADYTRESCKSAVALKFPRPKLNQITIDAINLEHYDVCKKLENKEILQNVDDYLDQFEGEIDATVPGRARFRIPTPIVQGLHQEFNIIDLIYG